MNMYIQFTERPVPALNLSIGGGSTGGPTRIHDLQEQMKDPEAPVIGFTVYGIKGEVLCAGDFLGDDSDRPYVLEKVRIHAENVDDVDPVRLVFADKSVFVYDADMGCVRPEVSA